MEKSKVCNMHGLFSSTVYCTKDISSRKVSFTGKDGDWDTYSDGTVEYRRRVTEVEGTFYRAEMEWKNVSAEDAELHPMVQIESLNRYIGLEIPGKDGSNLQETLIYKAPPSIKKAADLKYPGMTISICANTVMGVFTSDPGADCFFMKSWEGHAYHWLLFPLQSMKPGVSYANTVYLSLSDPTDPNPGTAEVYRRAEEVLKG